jgi:hypothetical protein
MLPTTRASPILIMISNDSDSNFSWSWMLLEVVLSWRWMPVGRQAMHPLFYQMSPLCTSYVCTPRESVEELAQSLQDFVIKEKRTSSNMLILNQLWAALTHSRRQITHYFSTLNTRKTNLTNCESYPSWKQQRRILCRNEYGEQT